MSTAESVSDLQITLRRVIEGAEFARLATEVRGGARVVSVSGLTSPAARALALAALQRETGRRFALVLETNGDLEAWERDLCFWIGVLRPHSGAAEEDTRDDD